MSTTSVAYEPSTAVTRPAVWPRLRDYFELTKPKIAALELVTVAVAACVASWNAPDMLLLTHALVGTTLVAASASIFNQLIERDVDALMPRTQDRPLAAGRVHPLEAVVLGAVTGLAGVAYLAVTTCVLTALFAAATWVLYVVIYTPMKTRSSLNTVVGAVAGALPALIGWTAVGGRLDLGAATLFLIVYLWQFPHFMAIAWLYRRHYAAARMRMLPVVDATGRRAGRQAVIAALALIPISLLPAVLTGAGPMYLAWALALGAGQLACAGVFCSRRDDRSARWLLRASLIYLPTLLMMLVLGPFV